MNRIVLTKDDILYVFQWRDKHPEFVRSSPNPMSGLKIICKDTGITIVGSRKDRRLLLRVYENKKPAGEIQYEFLPLGKARITRDSTKKFVKDDKESMLSLWCSLMALFVYGELQNKDEETVPEQRQSLKSRQTKPIKRKTESVTYILRNRSKSHTSSHKGSHAKKSGCFSVRGHFRHYKSGKVVWIAEFMKGTGKEQERTYKLGAERMN